MPAVIDANGRATPLRKAKPVKVKPKPRTPRPPTPAERVTTRSRARAQAPRNTVERQHTAAVPISPKRQRSMTPDTLDRFRSQSQKAKDAAGVKKAIGDSRARAKAKQTRPYAGARGQTVEHYGGQNTREALAALARPEPKKHTILVAGARGMTRPTRQSSFTGGELLSRAARNAPSDATELVVTMPTTIAHQAKTLATDPVKFAKEMAQPYIDIAKDPGKAFAERPVSTTLAVLPIGRGLTRGAGSVARRTGKQTLARADVKLPGTALKETPAGSRDVLVRGQQARKDRENPTPVVRANDVKRRVDEHHDFVQQKVQEAGDRAAKESKQLGHDTDTGKAHVEAARAQAKEDMKVAFAHEFGADQRPAVGAAEKGATKTERDRAGAHEKGAKRKLKNARLTVKTREAEAKAARGGSTDRLTDLEAERAAAQRALAERRGTHTKAQLEHAKAHGSARVSAATTKTTSTSRELRRERRNAARATTPQTVKDARAAVRDADRDLLAAERRGGRNQPEVVAARVSVRTAERQVDALERQLAREEQRASRLEGVTEGRHAAGRMTAGAGRATADQAEKVGYIKEALHAARKRADAANGRLKAIEGEAVHGARRAARGARANLRAAEGAARIETRTKVAGVDRAIGAEQRRVAGVAPKDADRLHAAIAGLDDSAASVRAGRQRIRAIDQIIGAERSRTRGVPPEQANRLINAMHDADDALTARAQAGAEHATAKARHISVKGAAANAPLVGGGVRGRIFGHKSDANKVAQRLNEAGHTLIDHKRGRRTQESVPLEFKVRKVGDGFAVVPTVAAERMYKSSRKGAPMSHQSVGTSPNTVAKFFRTSRRLFTQATLPLNPKWLAGQGIEAGVRGAIAGAGPLDWLRFNKTVKEMNAKHAGSGDDLKMRVMGGQFGLTGAAREFAQGTKTLADEFAGTGLERPARGLTRAGAVAPIRATRAGWGHYTRAVLGSVNGFFEQNARKAMAGQAIKSGVFNEKRFNALSDKAIADAAKGLKGTEAQVQLARQVDRMYGQYQKFSPELRSSLLHTTPFLPWYLNSIKFLTMVLPVDHPYITSMLAAASTTSEDWRKAHHLSTKGKEHRPDFLMGGFPFGGDEKISRLANFTPWGVASDPVASAGSVFLPQIVGPALNAAGVDWTGTPLRDQKYQKFSGTEKATRAGVSALEAQVPGVALAGRLSGLTKRYIDKKDPKKIEPFKTRLVRELPLVPVGASDAKKKKPAKVRKRTDAIGFGSGDGGGGGNAIGF